ncbi:MAG: hypothetical protein ACE5K1_08690 [Acidiferrobacterales bacterium]
MIHFVVALPAEARPLIDRYRLRRRHAVGPFPVYEAETTALIVSGVGKIAAAAATTYMHGLSGHPNDGWLNIGVAGHAERELGQAALAHRIIDQATGRSWYPPLVFAAPCETDAVLTVDQPTQTYAQPALYDMEASGFWQTACRFSTAELVQCLKIVSDNAAHPAVNVSADSVQALIEQQLESIECVVRALAALSAELAPLNGDPAELARFLARWRFTATERGRLQRLLTRWHALYPAQSSWCAQLEALASSSEVLRFLEEHLDCARTRLRAP